MSEQSWSFKPGRSLTTLERFRLWVHDSHTHDIPDLEDLEIMLDEISDTSTPESGEDSADLDAELVGRVREIAEELFGGNCTFADDDLTRIAERAKTSDSITSPDSNLAKEIEDAADTLDYLDREMMGYGECAPQFGEPGFVSGDYKPGPYAENAERLRAALRVALSEQNTGWMPIASLPDEMKKEAKWFWGYWPEAGHEDAICKTMWVQRYHDGPRFMDESDQKNEEPTHWMPLPLPPPTTGGRDE